VRIGYGWERGERKEEIEAIVIREKGRGGR
jgi:hypothetical protein